jgi:hypothetical protein
MVENSVPVDLLAGKDELVLFGECEASEHVRDFIEGALSTLGCFLELADDMAQHNDEARTVAATGKALLRQAHGLFDQFHEQLRQAGVGIYVGGAGSGWEPCGVTACAVKRLPATDPTIMDEDDRAVELSRAWSDGMGVLRDHPELAGELLDHLKKLVARTRETPMAGQA